MAHHSLTRRTMCPVGLWDAQ